MFKKKNNKNSDNEVPYENKYNFQKLTPTTLEDLKIYKDTFEFVFSNNDLKNIGITGAYSAGKSSVIETYKALNPDLKFLNISLAYFQSTDQEQIVEEAKSNGKSDNDGVNQGDGVTKGSDDTKNVIIGENILEGKILNQLIHQIEIRDIQQTNFRVKRHCSDLKLIFSGALITVLIFLVMFITKFTKWEGYVNGLKDGNIKNNLLITTSPLMLIFTGVGVISILTYMIFLFLKAQINHNIFKKLSIQGNTFEIFGQSDESYFDKYLNEVLYLFENCGADIIVFEDIDRYNSNQIFQRLREINMLVNHRKELSNKKTHKPMRFFYLLRDDIFINKDRTKFFDFIIPVVPVIDSSNSMNKFISYFKAGNVYHNFKEQFLQEISLYIDDMRILKNIYNEYIVYDNQIKTTDQKAHKLLSMVIYKNIFPRDFSNLQLNSGFIHTLFSKKESFLSDEKKELEKQISDIEASEREHLSIDEIEELYNYRISRSSTSGTSRLTKERESRKQILRDTKAIENEDIPNEIKKIEIEITKLQQKKLHEIINKENSDKIFKVVYENELGQTFGFEDIKSSNYFPLIKYLIKKGYIDETYPDYMSYFYDDSISSSDKIFLRSVIDEEKKLFNFKLDNPGKVASRLDNNYFDKEEVLNIYLVNFLLEQSVDKKSNELSIEGKQLEDIQLEEELNIENLDKLSRIIKQLMEKENLDFIDVYMEKGNQVSLFFKVLNKVWTDAFKVIHNEYSEMRKKQYAMKSVCYSEYSDLQKINVDDILTSYINRQSDILGIQNPDVERIVEAFKILNIKFKVIDYKWCNKELFTAVYKNSLYEINFDLICLMLKVIYGYTNEYDLKHKNYTLILSKPNEPLIRYINENIHYYISTIISTCDFINDLEDSVIQLLNTGDDIVSKRGYINKLKTPVTRMDEVTDIRLWTYLIDRGLLVYSDKNVLEYFFNNDARIDVSLTNYINNHIGEEYKFNYVQIDEKYGKGSGDKFLDAIVCSEAILVKAYENILNALNKDYSTFLYEGISDEKMDVLIMQKRFPMTLENLQLIRYNYPQKVVDFIWRNIETYVEEVINKDNFNFDELQDVLNMDVSDNNKISLLKLTTHPIKCLSDQYSDELKAYILKNNYDSSELPELLNTYNDLSESIKSQLGEISFLSIEEILIGQYPVPFQLCEKIFDSKLINQESKLTILAYSVAAFSLSECLESLEILKPNKIIFILKGRNTKLPITPTNKIFLDVFVEKNWIYEYDIDKKDKSVYRVKKVSSQLQQPQQI